MNRNKIKVLIPDGEEGNTRQVLFLLGNSNEYQLYILSNRKDDFIRYSRHCKKFYVSDVTEFNEIRLKNIIDIVEENGIDIILPTFVPCCQLVIENIDILKNKTGVILLSDINNYNTTVNKDLFAHFCLKNHINIPKTSAVDDITILNDLDDYSFPVLLKPSNGDGGKGIIKFDHKNHLCKFLSKKIASIKNKYILQEFVDSKEIDVNVLCLNGKILVYSIQKGIIPPDREFSFSKGVELISHAKILESVQQIVKKLNWNGIAHFDLLFNEETKEIHVLEINPRVWGTILASFRGGINFLDLLIKKSLNADFNTFPKKYRLIKYAALSKDLLIKISVGRSPVKLRETNIVFLLSDPLPSIMGMYSSWKKSFF